MQADPLTQARVTGKAFLPEFVVTRISMRAKTVFK